MEVNIQVRDAAGQNQERREGSFGMHAGGRADGLRQVWGEQEREKKQAR